jgi:hypothetical protein
MVAIGTLLVPVLLSAVLVFIMSSLVWMVLPHHKSDYGRLPDEDGVMDALGDVAPGMYHMPHAATAEEMKSPEMKAKLEKGPVGFLTVVPGMPNMGKNLGLWFVYCLWVSWLVAYVTSRTLEPGAEYLLVMQIACTVAWASYGMATVSDSVWFGRPWKISMKNLFDALLYGTLTGGAFGWLWPG